MSSAIDIALISLLAGTGTLVHALPWRLIAVIILASALFTLLLDLVKVPVFRRLDVA